MALACLLGAVIRIVYVQRYPAAGDWFPGGDGLDYHLMAKRLANGEGYVDGFAGVTPNAHHPPGWVTFLAGMVKLGFDTVISQQRVGIVIGVVLIAVIGIVTTQIFDGTTAVIAAFLAAVYPGFWVLDAQLLSEPLALVLLGVAVLLLVRLAAAPTASLAVMLGLVLGLAILTRSELLTMLVIVVPLALRQANTVDRATRIRLGALVAAISVAMLVPWAAYNAGRFQEPVLISSNLGTTLLAGNCKTFSGESLGFSTSHACSPSPSRTPEATARRSTAWPEARRSATWATTCRGSRRRWRLVWGEPWVCSG
ncbi:MAG: glycosyltransferase family 39 protein [Acidimicrobiales bacterium]